MRSAALALLVAGTALAAPPRAVAVAYFDNASADHGLDPLSKGFADLIITDLAQAKSVVVVEREKLQAVLQEQRLSRSPLADPTTAVKLGKLLAAQFILVGAFQVSKGSMRLDARLIEVATGAVATTTRVEAEQAEFFELAKEVVDAVVKALKLPLTVAERHALRQFQTESLDAFERYSRGLDELDRGAADRARAHFEAAVAADPRFRHARTTIERLDSLGKLAEVEQRSAARKRFEALRVDDPNLSNKLFELLNNPFGSYEELRLRLDVLRFIFERHVTPYLEFAGTRKRFYFEAQALVTLVDQYPSDAEIAPRRQAIVAYLRAKYPGAESVDEAVTTPVGQFRAAHWEAYYLAVRDEAERLTRDLATRR